MLNSSVRLEIGLEKHLTNLNLLENMEVEAGLVLLEGNLNPSLTAKAKT